MGVPVKEAEVPVKEAEVPVKEAEVPVKEVRKVVHRVFARVHKVFRRVFARVHKVFAESKFFAEGSLGFANFKGGGGLLPAPFVKHKIRRKECCKAPSPPTSFFVFSPFSSFSSILLPSCTPSVLSGSPCRCR